MTENRMSGITAESLVQSLLEKSKGFQEFAFPFLLLFQRYLPFLTPDLFTRYMEKTLPEAPRHIILEICSVHDLDEDDPKFKANRGLYLTMYFEEKLRQFLTENDITDHLTTKKFAEEFAHYLE